MVRILFVGDIVGRLGRETTGKILPKLRKRLKIDLCLANGENLAGGRGLTKSTVEEVIGFGVDYLTGGDHTFWQRSFKSEIRGLPVLRPVNLLDDTEGYGSCEVKIRRSVSVSILSLLGTGSSLIRTAAGNPFLAVDDFLSRRFLGKGKIIVADFHAETSSEKVAMSWYLDGRISALVGTHTHVPTSDVWILPKGSAYVTDLGMVGAKYSVIGVKSEIIISRFVHGDLSRFEWVKSGPSVFNSVLVEIDEKTGKAVSAHRKDFSIL